MLCEIRAPRLKELKEAVLPLMSAQDLLQCARFFSEGDRYDEMEDALFQGVEAAMDEASRSLVISEGSDLLRQASLNATDTSLAFCRMTREELNQAAEEICAAR